MLFCLVSFPPSAALLPYLVGYVRRRLAECNEDNEPDLAMLLKQCEKELPLVSNVYRQWSAPLLPSCPSYLPQRTLSC